MKKSDALLLREVQKNAQMATKAIDALAGKVYEDDLSLQLSLQSLKYAQLGNRAADRLLNGHTETYQSNVFEDAMLLGSIHANTLFDTSTSHIAELVMRGSSRGIAQLGRAIHANENAGRYAVEMARELMDFEEKSMEQMKKYL